MMGTAERPTLIIQTDIQFESCCCGNTHRTIPLRALNSQFKVAFNLSRVVFRGGID